MRARVAQATVRVWVEGRDDPCSLTVLVDPEGVDLSRPECFSPRAFMKSPSIYKRARVRGLFFPLRPEGEGKGEGESNISIMRCSTASVLVSTSLSQKRSTR